MLLSQLFETIFGFLDVNTDYSKKMLYLCTVNSHMCCNP